MSNIPSQPADGNIRTVLVTTLAEPDSPDIEDANDESAVDISCYLTAGGFALTTDQATITDERECDTVTRQEPGRKTYSLTITGIDNSNTANEAEFNELVEALVEGQPLYAIRRRGVEFDEPFTSGEQVTVIGFKPGERQEVPAEANSVLRSTWTCYVNELHHTEIAGASV